MDNTLLKDADRRSRISSSLDMIYNRYHKPEFIHPDPLEFVIKAKPENREVAGLIASSLAVGRVNLILKAIEYVLSKLPEKLHDLADLKKEDIKSRFTGFKYRFYDADAITDLLYGIGMCIRTYGNLEKCFIQGIKKDDINVLNGLIAFTAKIKYLGGSTVSMLPSPEKGSACKRLHLYLRWMIRKDNIDPGGWNLPSSMLIVPLDVHMNNISTMLGFTSRKPADEKTALEITDAFRVFDSEDPVRFDFSLTRLGIHPDLTYESLGEFYLDR